MPSGRMGIRDEIRCALISSEGTTTLGSICGSSGYASASAESIFFATFDGAGGGANSGRVDSERVAAAACVTGSLGGCNSALVGGAVLAAGAALATTGFAILPAALAGDEFPDSIVEFAGCRVICRCSDAMTTPYPLRNVSPIWVSSGELR